MKKSKTILRRLAIFDRLNKSISQNSYTFVFALVDSERNTKSAECPKLVHKSTRRSFERARYTPVRLDKKFAECCKKNELEGKEIKFNHQSQ